MIPPHNPVRKRRCPQCKRMRFIPHETDPYCTPSCKREVEKAERNAEYESYAYGDPGIRL